jgi:hypothetical protein
MDERNAVLFSGLLRACGDRPCRRTPDKTDKFPPPH